MKDKLQHLRSQIDAIDPRLVRLLNDRTKLVLEIGKLKHATRREIYAPDRRRRGAARGSRQTPDR